MRLIGRIYAELRLPHAAKQYALAVATIASSSGGSTVQDLVPEVLIDAVDYCYLAGAWGDAMAIAQIAIRAHNVFAEDAFNHDIHPSLEVLDFDIMTPILAADRFRPEILPVLRETLGETGYGELMADAAGELRDSFKFDEDGFVDSADEQLAGRAFADLGPQRTLTFAALGTVWRLVCVNDRETVLVAERFAAAAQILLVELAPGDPVFLPQEVQIEIIAGTPHVDRGPVQIAPNNDLLECTVVLAPYADYGDQESFQLELSVALISLLGRLSVRPEDQFLRTVEGAFAAGLVHKLHSARPYDETAGILPQDHYDLVSNVAQISFPKAHHPTPAPALSFPTILGPEYDRAASLANIRENYEHLPTLLGQTLPRALADPATLAGFWFLRGEGWLDWHILLALANVGVNFRAHAGGSSGRALSTENELRALAHEAETADSIPIPFAALTPKSLQEAMNMALIAVAQRRWRLLPPTSTPNIRAFRTLLQTRYGLADDVPHVDLLADAFTADGTVRPLVNR